VAEPACPERIRELLVREPAQELAHPARVRHSHPFKGLLILALVVKDDLSVTDAVNKRLNVVAPGVSFCAGWRVLESGELGEKRSRRTQRSPQVSNVIDALVSASAALLTGLDDLVVFCLEVPVIDERHQGLQALQLARAVKRVLRPGPKSFLFVAIIAAFKPHIANVEPAAPFDVSSLDEVVLIGVITCCPHDS